MSDPDREELKEQLRAMMAGRGDGIDLDTPFHWVTEGVKQPAALFEHLPELLPPVEAIVSTVVWKTLTQKRQLPPVTRSEVIYRS
jgi:hypothetical protein